MKINVNVKISPVDVRNAAIFHAGPIIRPLENDKFEMVSIGPTTSMRME